MIKDRLTHKHFPNERGIQKPSEQIDKFRKQFEKLCHKHNIDGYYLSIRYPNDDGKMTGAIITHEMSSKDLVVVINRAIMTHDKLVELEKFDAAKPTDDVN